MAALWHGALCAACAALHARAGGGSWGGAALAGHDYLPVAREACDDCRDEEWAARVEEVQRRRDEADASVLAGGEHPDLHFPRRPKRTPPTATAGGIG